jgi:pilus assembly protein TadC/methionine-rich copper-binding protein CopC
MRRFAISVLVLLLVLSAFCLTAQGVAAQGPIIDSVTPAENSTITTNAPTIVVEYHDSLGIDIPSVKLVVNGTDVTSSDWGTIVTSDGVTFAVPSVLPLQEGNNTVTISVANYLGEVTTRTWNFTVNTNYVPASQRIDVWGIIQYMIYALILVGVALVAYVAYLRLIRKITWKKYFAQHPERKKYVSLYLPIGIGAIVLVTVFLLIAIGTIAIVWSWELAAIVAFIVAAGPVAIRGRMEKSRLHRYEVAFAQFLFELADAIRGGIDPAKAVVEFSSGNTGVMKDQMQIAADGIRMGRPFEEMMMVMVEPMKSDLITRYASLIGEASKMGGDISVVIHRAAKDMDDMIRIEEERRRQVAMQATTIYISFAVLVVVVYQLISIYPSLGQFNIGLLGGSPLTAASAAPAVARMSFDTLKLRFFDMILIDAVGAGLLIGIFSEGKLKFGLLQAIGMVVVATVFFAVAVF